MFCELIGLFVLIFSVVISTFANLNSVLVKRTCKLFLTLALRIEKPPSPTNSSTSKQRKLHEKWDHSNYMSLMIIKHGIPEVFRGTVLVDITSAKEFLAEIEKRFAKSDKAETSTLLHNLIFMKYQGKGNVRENTLWECHILLQN